MSELESFDKVWTGIGTFQVARELGLVSFKADPVLVVIRTEQLCCASTYGCMHDRAEIMSMYREAADLSKITIDDGIEWKDLSFSLRKIHRVENQIQIPLPCSDYEMDLNF